MPRFLHPDAPALNSLNTAKKRVIKQQRDKYKDSQSFQQQALIRGEAEKIASALYDQFFSLLTNFATVLFEIENVSRVLERGDVRGNMLVERFIGSATASFKAVELISQFLERKLKYNINIFSPDQVASLFSVYQYIDSTIGEIDGIIEDLDGVQQRELTELMSGWEPVWSQLDKRLAPLFQNYKYGLDVDGAGFFDDASSSSGSTFSSDTLSSRSSGSSGSGRRRILKCGGTSPAGARVVGPFIGMSGKVAPRNTYDFHHPSLPRRFH
jgi:hypothetical protein